jgi:hypothetical protein
VAHGQIQVGAYPEWMDLRAIQEYACVSDRTLGDWIHRPIDPLPAVQVAGGKLRVRRATFDRWLEAHPYKPVDSIDVDQLTNDIIEQFRKAA